MSNAPNILYKGIGNSALLKNLKLAAKKQEAFLKAQENAAGTILGTIHEF